MKSKNYVQDYTVSKEDREIVVTFNDNSVKAKFQTCKQTRSANLQKIVEEIFRVNNGFGISIVSTSKGMMTGSQARKQKLGGEIICEIF